MHSTNDSVTQMRSFIEEARRAQIVETTIDVLAEVGFINTSFSKIAERAGIAPSLISYHFKSKEELTKAVFYSINRQRRQHVAQQLSTCTTAADKLRVALEADLANMGCRPRSFQALAEVIFTSRTDTGALVYMQDERSGQPRTAIRDILVAGQESGEFRDFNADNLALIIEAARDSFLAQLPLNPALNLESFTATLVNFALESVRKDT